MTPVLIGVLAVGFMAAAVRMPTLRHAHAAIIRLRAAGMMAREMWAGAMSRRSRWEECLSRAKYDV